MPIISFYNGLSQRVVYLNQQYRPLYKLLQAAPLPSQTVCPEDCLSRFPAADRLPKTGGSSAKDKHKKFSRLLEPELLETGDGGELRIMEDQGWGMGEEEEKLSNKNKQTPRLFFETFDSRAG